MRTRVPLVCCTACNATAHFAPAHQPRLYLAVRRRAVVHDVTSTFRRPLAIHWSQRGDRPPDQHLGCMRRLTPSASLRCADVRLPGARLRQGVPKPQRACAVPPPPPPPAPRCDMLLTGNATHAPGPACMVRGIQALNTHLRARHPRHGPLTPRAAARQVNRRLRAIGYAVPLVTLGRREARTDRAERRLAPA